MVSIHEIAEAERMPLKFLEQILGVLKKGGILTSRRGMSGGYRLSRPANQIYLGEVIRLVEGPLSPWANQKVLQERLEKRDKHIGFYALLMDVRNAISQIMDKTTLDEICERGRKMMEQQSSETMFYI